MSAKETCQSCGLEMEDHQSASGPYDRSGYDRWDRFPSGGPFTYGEGRGRDRDFYVIGDFGPAGGDSYCFECVRNGRFIRSYEQVLTRTADREQFGKREMKRAEAIERAREKLGALARWRK